MSLRHFPFLAVLLVCAATAQADNAAKPEAKTEAKPDAKPEVVPPYELKNHSTFTAADIARVPFWPIGWVKRKVGVVAQAPVQEAPKMLLDEKAFRVTSILIGTGSTPSLAVINGRAYSEGEFLHFRRTPGVAPMRIRVQRINDGTVILQNGEQIMVASLARAELQNRRPDEQLLDPDR